MDKTAIRNIVIYGSRGVIIILILSVMAVISYMLTREASNTLCAALTPKFNGRLLIKACTMFGTILVYAVPVIPMLYVILDIREHCYSTNQLNHCKTTKEIDMDTKVSLGGDLYVESCILVPEEILLTTEHTDKHGKNTVLQAIYLSKQQQTRLIDYLADQPTTH